MIATRDNLLIQARNIRESLKGLPEADVIAALREVIKYYAPHYRLEDLEGILRESGPESEAGMPNRPTR